MSIKANYSYQSLHMGNSRVERDEGGGLRECSVPVYCNFLNIHVTDPYERGRIHGQVLQQQIRTIYAQGEKLLEEAKNNGLSIDDVTQVGMQIINNSKEEHIQEMRGLADGAQLPYEQVALINAMPVAFASFMGCTAITARVVDGKAEALSADNGSQTQSIAWRRSKIIKSSFEDMPVHVNALNAPNVNMNATIRSKVFNPVSKSVVFSMGIERAAQMPRKKLSQKTLFGQSDAMQDYGADTTFHLAHNLDFMGFGRRREGYNPFAENQLILVREHENGVKTAAFTFPGLIGITEGMNSHGVSLSVLTQQAINNPSYAGGEHNHFAFYDALCQTTTAAAFLDSLEPRCLAAPLNLVGCDATTAFSLEWHKNEATKTGWDYHQILSS